MADIMREIDKTFGKSEPEIAHVCTKIVAYLSKQPVNRRLHLTYSILKKEAAPKTDTHLVAAIQYLTGATADLLEMEFEFLDESGEYHPLPKAVVALAEREKALEHPVTGELIQDYKSHVLVYFIPTQRALSTLHPKGVGH